MINLRVLVPEATINYVQNPAFRFNTNGWTASGATLTRSLDYSRVNIASGKVVTNGSVLNEGVYYRVNGLSGVSEPITASVYVRGQGKIRLRLIDNPIGKQWVFDPDESKNLRLDRWQRFDVTGFSTGSNDMRLYVETSDTVARAITFYVDGAQMERKPYPTTYCDGDRDGCRWNIVAHGSNSSRTGDTRLGGRWVALAGPCRTNNDLYVTVLGGFGMPPITNNIQSWSNAPGSFFQSEKVQNRVVTLSFTAKKEALRTSGTAPSLRALHELRQQLIDLIKPNKTLNSEPFLFEYSDTDSDKPLYIQMRYEAGLEGDWDIRNRWYNSFPVRMIAVDPFFTQDTQDAMQMGAKNSVPYGVGNTISNTWTRINGQWNQITVAGQPVLANVTCSAVAPDGNVYFGCSYASAHGGNILLRWDGNNITYLGVGSVGSILFGLSISADGTIYVTGDFTSIGGVAMSRVGKYNPTTGTWSAMGTGLGGSLTIGYGICAAPNGQIYVVGDFTTAGGINCYRIARWDGLQWRTVGATSGFNDMAKCIINAGDGKNMYVGGSFLTSNGGGVTYNFAAKIDITTNLISQLGYGVSGGVLALTVGLDGTLYAGGFFTTSGAPGASPLLRVAKYSGGQIWEPMGSGLDQPVYCLVTGKNGEIYAGGYFGMSGTKVLSSVSKWYGENWNPVEFPRLGAQGIITTNIETIIVTNSGDLFASGNIAGSTTGVYYPKLTTLTNNGTAPVYPKMYVQGQGILRYISNTKTGQEIFLNLPIFAGEDVFIDFAQGKITSTTRGDLSYTILPGSEIRSIYLLPGDNMVSVLITDEVTPICQMRWTLQDWSADAVVNAGAL